MSSSEVPTFSNNDNERSNGSNGREHIKHCCYIKNKCKFVKWLFLFGFMIIVLILYIVLWIYLGFLRDDWTTDTKIESKFTAFLVYLYCILCCILCCGYIFDFCMMIDGINPHVGMTKDYCGDEIIEHPHMSVQYNLGCCPTCQKI